jgi:ABC-type transporter Mla MlaB component
VNRKADGQGPGVSVTHRPGDNFDPAGPADSAWVRLEAVSGPGVLRVLIDGEVDFCTLDQLGAALRALVLNDGVLVQLDVVHLRFVDVAALRLLTGWVREARRTGHRVCTTGAGLTLRKVAALLEIDDDLGIS